MALVCSIALSPGALGGTNSTTIFVSATVVSSCRISTDTLSFSDYHPGDANAHSPLDATATVTLTCSPGVEPAVRLSEGENPARTAGATRAMSGDGGYLSYDIFIDPNRTDVWTGNKTGALSLSPASSAALRQYQMTMYGRIPAGQRVPPGAYHDTVKVSVDF